MYSPSIGPGNLIASITPNAGANDGHGNAFDAGVTVYGHTFTAELSSGLLRWFNSSDPASAPAFIEGQPASGGSILELSSGQGRALATSADLDLLDSDASGTGSAQIFTPVQLAALSALFQTPSASTTGADIQVSGDGHPRIRIRPDSILFGSGSAVPDTNIYRGAVNQLKTDDAFNCVAGTVANPTIISTGPWNDLGTIATGMSVTVAKYRLNPVNGSLDISIRNLNPSAGTDTDGSVIWSAANGLLASYRPNTPKRVPVYCNNLRVPSTGNFEGAAIEIEIDGSIQCFGWAGSATRVDGHIMGIPIDL